MNPTIIFVLAAVTISSGSKLPPNFPKCNRQKPDFDECILKAVQKSVSQMTKPYPEINLPNVSPYEVEELTIGQNSGPVSVQQKFKNCKLFGITDVKFDKVSFDFKNRHLDISGEFPEIRKVCKYEMKGQVLVLPVDGKGDSTITMKNLKVTDRLSFEEKTKKNKTFLKFTTSDITLDPDLVTFNFQSSFNKDITERINPVLNENWKEIFGDVKKDYGQLFDRIILATTNGIFNKVPLQEVFDD